jgi:hypothetical protein
LQYNKLKPLLMKMAFHPQKYPQLHFKPLV